MVILLLQDKVTINNRQLPIITPKRKNQKNNIIKQKDQKLLQERHKIENVFAIMNNNHRVMVRRDKKIINYFSFVYICYH